MPWATTRPKPGLAGEQEDFAGGHGVCTMCSNLCAYRVKSDRKKAY